MRIVIAGVCGFVGSSLARALSQQAGVTRVIGIDNLMRPGSEINVPLLKKIGVDLRRGDVRNQTDVEALPDADWVIDAAANPSVLAGLQPGSSSRQLLEHNLIGSLNLLDYARVRKSGFILLSTSRVYSIKALVSLPLVVQDGAFTLDLTTPLPTGLGPRGVNEEFPTSAPISLYGSTKLASEVLALEYGSSFGFPVWVNRCGVMAGAGQFGTAEQGIFSYWIHATAARKPLRYIGFDGTGFQSRDALHPSDLAALVWRQMLVGGSGEQRVFTVGGGQAVSLLQLSRWCESRLGAYAIDADRAPRPFDVPWLAMDSSRAEQAFGWRAQKGAEQIFDEILEHAHRHPDWLERAK